MYGRYLGLLPNSSLYLSVCGWTVVFKKVRADTNSNSGSIILSPGLVRIRCEVLFCNFFQVFVKAYPSSRSRSVAPQKPDIQSSPFLQGAGLKELIATLKLGSV